MQQFISTSGNGGDGTEPPATYAQRFQTLLQSRSIPAWAETVGIATTTVYRLAKGQFPDLAKLIPMVRVERVSLSWLTDGRGAPFLVTATMSDAETAEVLAATLHDEPDQALTLICTDQGEPKAAVLTQPAAFLHQDTWIKYTAVQVISGPIATGSIAAIAQHSSGTLKRLTMTRGQIGDLSSGQMGNVPLIGWAKEPGGMLDTANTMPRASLAGGEVKEDSAAYTLTDPDLQDATDILQSLSPTERRTVLTMLRALAPKA